MSRRSGSSQPHPGLHPMHAVLGAVGLMLDPELRRTVRDAAVSALAPTLMDSLRRASPGLTPAQASTVESLVTRGLSQCGSLRLREGEQSLRAAVGLAAPGGSARGTWEEWLGLLGAAGVVLDMFAPPSGGHGAAAAGAAPPPAPPRGGRRRRPGRDRSDRHSSSSTSDSSSTRGSADEDDPDGLYADPEDAHEQRVALKKFKIPRKYLDNVPPVALPCLLAACRESPQCSISLESLVNAKGHLVKGVVALIQPAHEIDPRDRRALHDPASWHCFLFKAEALRGWFSSSRTAPTNPMTRSAVDLRRQIFPLTTSETFGG